MSFNIYLIFGSCSLRIKDNDYIKFPVFGSFGES